MMKKSFWRRLNHGTRNSFWERGALSADLVVAMAILVTVMMPITFAFVQETRLCRSYYFQAVAMEVVDGEMEILAAGEWRAFQPGRQSYVVRSDAVRQLPPGKFVLTVGEQTVRLEWAPGQKRQARPVAREVKVR